MLVELGGLEGSRYWLFAEVGEQLGFVRVYFIYPISHLFKSLQPLTKQQDEALARGWETLRNACEISAGRKQLAFAPFRGKAGDNGRSTLFPLPHCLIVVQGPSVWSG